MDIGTPGRGDGTAESEFLKDLAAAINRHSREGGSNTPDFLLAEYLSRCLDSFDAFVKAREAWYGVQYSPGAGVPPVPAGPVAERGPRADYVIFDETTGAGEAQ